MGAGRVTILVTFAFVAAAACGGDNGEAEPSGNSAAPLPVTVTAENIEFHPDSLEGHATHTVALTFVNEDDTTHSFTIDEIDVDVEADGGEETQTSFTPEETGTFEFYCRYHPDTMRGEFEVS